MHHLVDATLEAGRRRGAALDRPAARLALLTVVDHLDAALDAHELAVLSDALPLALSLLLLRRSHTERTRFDLVDERVVRAACDALAARAPGSLGDKLRDDVPGVLLGGGPGSPPDGEPRSSSAPTDRPDQRPTTPAPPGAEAGRPTVNMARCDQGVPPSTRTMFGEPLLPSARLTS